MIITVLDGHTLNPGDLSWDRFKEFGELRVYQKTEDPDLLDRLKDADIILNNKVPMTEDMLQHAPNLKYVGMLATGYDVLDLDALKKHGVAVTNIPEYGTDAVAQMTFALLLEMTNHVGIHDRSVKALEWTHNEYFSYFLKDLEELAGKTMGIVGYGKIGRAVAKIALAFNMNVIATPSSKPNDPGLEAVQFMPFEEMLSEVDILSFHCPLTEKNHHMLNKDTLARLKDTALIVNTARGGLIDGEALADALNERQIKGAALDVVEIEPIQEDSPLLEAENVILTPHIAWAPHESRARLMDTAFENLKAFLEGKELNRII